LLFVNFKQLNLLVFKKLKKEGLDNLSGLKEANQSVIGNFPATFKVSYYKLLDVSGLYVHPTNIVSIICCDLRTQKYAYPRYNFTNKLKISGWFAALRNLPDLSLFKPKCA